MEFEAAVAVVPDQVARAIPTRAVGIAEECRVGEIGPAEVPAHHAGTGDDEFADGPTGRILVLGINNARTERVADPADREGAVAVGRDCTWDWIRRADIRLGRAVEIPHPCCRPACAQPAERADREDLAGEEDQARDGKPGRSACSARSERIEGAEYQTLIRRSARKSPSLAGSFPSPSPIRTNVHALRHDAKRSNTDRSKCNGA